MIVPYWLRPTAERPLYAQRSGGCKAMQCLSPEGLGLASVLLPQPGDVVAVGTTRWQVKDPSLADGFVTGEDLAHYGEDTPSVQQHMVEAPGEMRDLLAQ